MCPYLICGQHCSSTLQKLHSIFREGFVCALKQVQKRQSLETDLSTRSSSDAHLFPYCTFVFCTILYYIVLYCTILYYILRVYAARFCKVCNHVLLSFSNFEEPASPVLQGRRARSQSIDMRQSQCTPRCLSMCFRYCEPSLCCIPACITDFPFIIFSFYFYFFIKNI
jgi:hypothetical protein